MEGQRHRFVLSADLVDGEWSFDAFEIQRSAKQLPCRTGVGASWDGQ